jgi:putative methionine-R-sulfoxide reductase with GAF domain
VSEHQREIISICQNAVQRLAAELDDVEVGCLFRFGDVLRHIAHDGRFHLIYEIQRSQGGVVWRAVERGEIQVVEDVNADPDYLTSDESIRSELAAPIRVGAAGVVAVLDVEFAGRVFDSAAVEVVAAEAEGLGSELEPYVS